MLVTNIEPSVNKHAERTDTVALTSIYFSCVKTGTHSADYGTIETCFRHKCGRPWPSG